MSPRRRKWTATEVVDAIRAHYGLDVDQLVQEEWALHTEVALRTPKTRADGTPYPRSYWSTNERRIDVLLVRNWAAGNGHERIAIEIKVDRADYRRETPQKRAPAEHAAHRCYYAAPAGLIDPDTLPEGWGLIEVDDRPDTEHYRVVRRAARRTPDADLDYLVAALARIGGRAVERIRRGDSAGAEVAQLRDEIERLSGALARRDEALHTARRHAAEARSELLSLAAGDTECADCGTPLTYTRPGRYSQGGWQHVEEGQESICYRLRQDAWQQSRQAATGAAYLRGYAAAPEPKALRELREEEPARRDTSAATA